MLLTWIDNYRYLIIQTICTVIFCLGIEGYDGRYFFALSGFILLVVVFGLYDDVVLNKLRWQKKALLQGQTNNQTDRDVV